MSQSPIHPGAPELQIGAGTEFQSTQSSQASWPILVDPARRGRGRRIVEYSLNYTPRPYLNKLKTEVRVGRHSKDS